MIIYINTSNPPYVADALLLPSAISLLPEILHCIAFPLFPDRYLPAGFLGVTGKVQIISPATYPLGATTSTSSTYNVPNLCSDV